jgi:flagellar biosynthesis anti-sigma factor FlgM
MKISGINRPSVDTNLSARRVAQRDQGSAGSKVAVSHEAKKLAEARAPAVSDAAKIARLTAAIARGDFFVDANQVAQRMLEEEG